ncbi:ATP-binding protein [Frateuria edaphi]|uniref:ATP-binding protein n=1 Tax=Frateuria edaphi TaxID=2898793 RepID=UPI001E559A27|nr:ATP-binding protein [Frateuria edaphi]UGB46616.1 ATP-binding protein [Frateuria edaphi]
MKVSIGIRLFLAMSLSMLAVAAVGVGLVRWKFSGDAPGPVTQAEQDQLYRLRQRLAAAYQVHHGWSFVPAGTDIRASWLRQQLALAGGRPADATDVARSTLGYRLGLLDAQDRYLAGALAHPLLVAAASIDRTRFGIVVDGRAVGNLVLAKPGKPDDGLAVAFLMQQQANLALLALIGAALSALAAGLLAAGFRRPIAALVEGSRRLGKARFDTRVAVTRGDELGELANAFNQLAARLDDGERSRRQWVADTSHELRTPLSVLRAQLEALQDGVRAPTPENLALLLRQVQSLGQLVEDLYALACADAVPLPYAMGTFDAWRVVEDAWRDFAGKFQVHGLHASLTAPDVRAFVRGDADRLRQVLCNLFENALRYTRAGGRVDLLGEVGGSMLRILLDDSAPGVPHELLERLGERFFRVEPSRSRQFGGAGLGLALSRQIVEAHGGQLDFSLSPLGGLRVTLTLPLEH